MERRLTLIKGKSQIHAEVSAFVSVVVFGVRQRGV